MFLSTAKMVAPACANRTVTARPLPHPGPTQPAPVTIAILPCRRPWAVAEGLLLNDVSIMRSSVKFGGKFWRDTVRRRHFKYFDGHRDQGVVAGNANQINKPLLADFLGQVG